MERKMTQLDINAADFCLSDAVETFVAQIDRDASPPRRQGERRGTARDLARICECSAQS
jgi:hypothetical protein